MLALAAVLMGAVVYGAALLLARWLGGQPLPVEVAALALLIAVGLAFYAAAVQATGAIDLRRVVRGLLRRA
jgi:peptidoglycan biosynthesis protein MviN/MurJ (putative lipid II flippase)